MQNQTPKKTYIKTSVTQAEALELAESLGIEEYSIELSSPQVKPDPEASVWKLYINVTETNVKTLWDSLTDVCVNDDEEIDNDWLIFPANTHREYIWQWFESTLDASVAELMGLAENIVQEA